MGEVECVRPGRQQRVRVWFGSHVIAAYVAEPGEAERYALAMGRRFAGLRVTIDDQASRFDPLLPHRARWDRLPLPGERPAER
jgi:hypothetical protein